VSRISLRRSSARTLALVVGGAVASAFAVQTGFGAFGSSDAPAAPLVSSAPLRPTISTRATVAFDRAAGLTYECSLDRRGFLPCRSTVVFKGLSRGGHVFDVRARASTGVTSSASAYSWTVVRRHSRERLPLQPLLTTAPVQPSISRNATFAWLLQRSATAECRLDARAWQPCVDPKTYRGLRIGTHVFRVRATRGDHRRSTVNRFTWTIYASAPPAAPTITSGPDKDTTSADAVFGFEVAAGSGFECRLDRSGWQQCSNPAIYVGLGSGTHTFCVHAVAPARVEGPDTCASWMVHSQPTAPSGAFTISGDLPPSLSPGAGLPLTLTVSNPFDFDLSVTALTVTVAPGSSQPGCDGPANLQVTQSNVAGGSLSIVVPAHGSVTLPAQGATAPQVTMLDLATNQNACKNAVFTFSYSGSGTRT
jgi:hypothetical protein